MMLRRSRGVVGRSLLPAWIPEHSTRGEKGGSIVSSLTCRTPTRVPPSVTAFRSPHLITASVACPNRTRRPCHRSRACASPADTSPLPLAPIDGFCGRHGAVRWRTCFSNAVSAGLRRRQPLRDRDDLADSTACAFGRMRSQERQPSARGSRTTPRRRE